MAIITESAIAYVLMNESILLEDRLEYLKQNTKTLSTDHDTLAKHKDTPSIVQHLADNADPTKNKAHTQYAVGLYRNKALKQEDAPRLKDALTDFEKYKGKLKPEEKVVNTKNYPTITHIENVIAPHKGTPVTSKEKTAHLRDNLNIKGKHELKYEDDNIKIFHNADKETAKKIYCSKNDPKPGPHNTEWCTSRDTKNNMFDHYMSQSPGSKYHVVHRKSDGAVFQYHPESNQFMDKNDDPISHEDFQSISPSLHKAWKEKPELI
jgi:hypothetical protein